MEELFESVADSCVSECDGGLEEDVWFEPGDFGHVDG